MTDDHRASYAIVDATAAGYTLTHRRVAYDTDAVVAQLRRVGHPATTYIAGFYS